VRRTWSEVAEDIGDREIVERAHNQRHEGEQNEGGQHAQRQRKQHEDWELPVACLGRPPAGETGFPRRPLKTCGKRRTVSSCRDQHDERSPTRHRHVVAKTRQGIGQRRPCSDALDRVVDQAAKFVRQPRPHDVERTGKGEPGTNREAQQINQVRYRSGDRLIAGPPSGAPSLCRGPVEAASAPRRGIVRRAGPWGAAWKQAPTPRTATRTADLRPAPPAIVGPWE